MAKSDGWGKRFDDPIVLPDGKKLATLRDDIKHLGETVPKRERDHPAVLTAADHQTLKCGHVRRTTTVTSGRGSVSKAGRTV